MWDVLPYHYFGASAALQLVVTFKTIYVKFIKQVLIKHLIEKPAKKKDIMSNVYK